MRSLRKTVAFVLALIVFAVSASFSASAAGFTVSLKSVRPTVPRYGAVVVTAYVESIDSEGGLLSVDFPFQFDDDVFELVSVTAEYPSAWNKPDNFSYGTATDGVVWLRMLNDDSSFGPESGCTEDGAMAFKVTLRVKGSAPLGETVISTKGNSTSVSGTAADGLCSPVYGVGAELSLTVTEVAVGDTYGDVNGDDMANSLDAAFVLRYDAFIIDMSEQQLTNADVNLDGVVNSLDASVILKYDAGMVSALPVF